MRNFPRQPEWNEDSDKVEDSLDSRTDGEIDFFFASSFQAKKKNVQYRKIPEYCSTEIPKKYRNIK